MYVSSMVANYVDFAYSYIHSYHHMLVKLIRIIIISIIHSVMISTIGIDVSLTFY